MKKIIGIIVFVIAIILVGIVISKDKAQAPAPEASTSVSPSASVSPSVSNSPSTSASPASEVKSYSLTDIALHATKTDCWSAINGKVYNLSGFVDKHPGGEKAIMGICGKDGSPFFNDQHEGERRPANELAKLYIGELK